MEKRKIGIIGGFGWLGAGIVKALLDAHFIPPQNLWISHRKEAKLADFPHVKLTRDNQELVSHTDLIILAVQPLQFLDLKIQIQDQLVLSIMAGVPISKIAALTHTQKIIRSMPNAALTEKLSFTPWTANEKVQEEDKTFIQKLLQTFGTAEEVKNEDEIDFFTALTGSGHGWLAYFAKSLIDAGVSHGIDPLLAERAIRQLMHGIGKLIAKETPSPAETVKLLIDYAGTTAAGLNAFQRSPFNEAVKAAIESSYQKAHRFDPSIHA